VQMQVNESGSFHAGRYSNLARRFWLRHDLVFGVSGEPSLISGL
jgi:hypothetical protein